MIKPLYTTNKYKELKPRNLHYERITSIKSLHRRLNEMERNVSLNGLRTIYLLKGLC
jgi:hypothetical protein